MISSIKPPSKDIQNVDDNIDMVKMEYKIIILEKLGNGSLYTHTFPLEPDALEEGLKFRALHFHSDCVFILEYCTN